MVNVSNKRGLFGRSMMSYLDYAITKNKSTLKFRIMLSQRTSKRAQYPYEKVLTDYMDEYIKRNHPHCKRNRAMRFSEVYDDYGIRYLQVTFPIYNRRGEEKIIEVDY